MTLSYEGDQHYNSILSSETEFGRLLTPPGQFEDARLAELKSEHLVMNGGFAEGKCDAVIKKAIKESLAAEASVDHSGDESDAETQKAIEASLAEKEASVDHSGDESEKNGGDDSSIPAPLPRSTAIWTNEHDWVGSRVMCWDAYKADDEPGAVQFGTVEAHNASNDIFLVVMDDGMKSFINKDGVEAAKDEWERSDKKSVLKHFMRLSKRAWSKKAYRVLKNLRRRRKRTKRPKRPEAATKVAVAKVAAKAKAKAAKAKAAKVKAAKTKTKQQALEAQ